IDAAGNTYVAGWTQGTNSQGFVAKYDPTGKQVYLTAFQATDPDAALGYVFNQTQVHAIAVDTVGNVYVTGQAHHIPSPIFGAGELDGFLLKLNAAGSRVTYSTGFGFGTAGRDVIGEGVVVDSANEAIITGQAKISASETEMVGIKYNSAGTR